MEVLYHLPVLVHRESTTGAIRRQVTGEPGLNDWTIYLEITYLDINNNDVLDAGDVQQWGISL